MQMNRRLRKPALLLIVVALVAMSTAAATLEGASAGGGGSSVPFAEAKMIIERNATDGDTGFQIFADADPWRRLQIIRPDGRRMLNIEGQSELQNFGLTELFSESNEPPEDEFPLERFKARFPAGTYRFRGETIEGDRLVGSARFSHDIPDGPEVVAPAEDATVGRDNVIVRWKPVREGSGINIVGYQVTVDREDPARTFSVDLRQSAREVEIPKEFLERRTEYSGEVLAIEASGNQTITEFSFRTR
jgi:hypothetical protein